MKVTLSGFIKVSAEDLESVKQHLSSHIALTRREPGCLSFDVTQRESDPSLFDVYEEFLDATAFRSHQTRVAASDWGNITKNIERHYEVTGLDGK